MVLIEFRYQIIKSNFTANIKDTVKEAITKSEFIYTTNNNFDIIVHNKKIKGDEVIESIMTQKEKQDNKIVIVLMPLNTTNNDIKDIICPECLQLCKLSIKDYRINLCHPSGLHNIDNMTLYDFKKSQNELLGKMECNNCKIKGEYICSECNFYLCQKCKDIHEKENHKIFNIEEIKYLCKKHGQLFNKYCRECEENICELCEKDHSEHYIDTYKDIFPDIDDAYQNLNKLKKSISIFKNNLKDIIKKLNKVVENMEIFYQINEAIINSYSKDYTYYEKIQTIIDINNNINKELENIDDCEYGYNVNKILYLYNDMEDKNEETEINYEFINIDDSDTQIDIFGKKFISNNLNKCKIIFNDNEYDLSYNFYASDLSSLYSGELTIILKGINNIINMSSMFENCRYIRSLSGLNKINTSRVINMKNMFSGCSELIGLPNMNKWDTSNVISMEEMFSGNILLKQLPDISKWDVSNVTSMMMMFNNCESLLSLPDISKWNMSSNTDMRYMFCNCQKLFILPDISKWNLINVKNMTSLFKDCISLISLPNISNWNTSNVITMNDLFQNCRSLTFIPDISKWNIINVSDFSYSFLGCTSLTSLPDLSKWDIKKCRNLDGMFINCSSLISLPNMEKWQKYKIGNKHSMFKRCFNSLNIPLIEI